MRYVHLYNTQLPQAALHARSPLQAMKDWHKLKPELFNRRPYRLAGCDNYARATLTPPKPKDEFVLPDLLDAPFRATCAALCSQEVY